MVNSLFQWLVVAAFSLVHPFYVSVVEMEHNTKDQSLDVSVRIFTDDLEGALKQAGYPKPDLASTTDKTAADKMVAQYIQQHLKITVNNKAGSLQYVGYEVVKESVFAYFEIAGVSQVKKVDADCNLLYEYQPQQINILHVTANKNKQSFKLDNPATRASFGF
jgi:hypothetical protein